MSDEKEEAREREIAALRQDFDRVVKTLVRTSPPVSADSLAALCTEALDMAEHWIERTRNALVIDSDSGSHLALARINEIRVQLSRT